MWDLGERATHTERKILGMIFKVVEDNESLP
jgi:hypothetical protein